MRHDSGGLGVCERYRYVFASIAFDIVLFLFFAGVASFGNGTAQWSLDAQVQVDYWFTTVDAPVGGGTWDGRLDDLYSHYVDATGHAPMLPDYGGRRKASKTCFVL